MMAITIFMQQAPGLGQTPVYQRISQEICCTTAWRIGFYSCINPQASCVGRAYIKNGAGPLKDPRRRDIAPTGELAGLPARDAPKTLRVMASLESGRGLQKSSKKSVIHRRDIKLHPGRFRRSAHAA